MQEMNNSPTESKLFELALSARSKAYVPYSKFPVGAAIESASGNFYAGCNVENISYPVGTCAEAGAIAAMAAGGDYIIKKILIVADAKELITPCGACLQRIKEFSTDETEILLASPDGIKKTFKLSQMLPFGFDNPELKHD